MSDLEERLERPSLYSVSKNLGDKVRELCSKKSHKYAEYSDELATAFCKAAIKMKDRKDLDKIIKFFDKNVELPLNIAISLKEINLDKDYILKLYKILDREENKYEIVRAIDTWKKHKKSLLDYFEKIKGDELLTVSRTLYMAGDQSAGFDATFSPLKANYHKPHIDKVGKIIVKAAQYTSKRACKLISLILEKYSDNKYENICDVLTNNNLIRIKIRGFEQLEYDVSYEAIKLTKNPNKLIENILFKNYGLILEKIGRGVCHADLALVKSTYELVREIHRERPKYAEKLEKGFFQELNRAMDQGNSSQMLRQYCREVQDKMLDNASELRVVRND